MNVCMIKWNSETDETEIKWSVDFMQSEWVVKADILKDVSHDMTKLYNEILKAQIISGRNK